MDLFNLLALNAANSAFNQQLLLTDSNTQIDEPLQSESPKQQGVERTQKRRRLRRHPVWQFFGDVGEKVVGCKLCSFNTVSAFSTNLKMHLKSHHKHEFIAVMEKELDQLSKENEHCDPASTSPSNLSDLDNGAPRSKRRRKTVQELRETINRCKQSLDRDKNHRSFAKNTYISACAKPNTSPFKVDNSVMQDEIQHVASPALSTQIIGCKEDSSTHTETESSKIDFQSLIVMLKTWEKDPQTSELAFTLRQNLQQAAFAELINETPNVLTPAFQNFVYTLDPNFKISDDHLQQTTNPKTSV
ncbi:hypothetical protein M3Y97_00813100 [Aphelenchoides bicaudatus]|nr:hypothetical protein M3Y97_00813100 [Aphelenchoides bicaudatus]